MITNAKLIGPVDPDAYHQQARPAAKRGDPDFVMSRSELMMFDECPAKWIRGWTRKESTSTEWGSLMDALVLLTKLQFERRYVVAPAEYPAEVKGQRVMKPWNWNATFCKEWRDEQSGKTVLKESEWQEAQSALAALGTHNAAGEKQVMAVAEWRESGLLTSIPLKVLIDIVPDNPAFHACLADFKTSASADPKRWPFVVDSYGYDVQAALYLDAYNAATGEERTDWLHIVQENEPPYHVELILLGSEFIELGRAKYRAALQHYAECLRTGVWGGYSVPSNVLRYQGIPIVSHTAAMQQRMIDRMPAFDEPPPVETDDIIP